VKLPTKENNPFAKYSGGYEGSFANLSAFFGGLDKLIGEPQKNVAAAIRAEHCDVADGFGASDTEQTAGNYGVVFTPKKEYLFVADPDFNESMSAGVHQETKRAMGDRPKRDIRVLQQDAVALIRAEFREMGWSEDAVTDELWADLKVQESELVGLRLYTGPMFIFYNGALRAMATGGVAPFGQFQGMDVRGAYVTTIHAINSGLIKLSRLQPCCSIYRGMSGMVRSNARLFQVVTSSGCSILNSRFFDWECFAAETAGAVLAGKPTQHPGRRRVRLQQHDAGPRRRRQVLDRVGRPVQHDLRVPHGHGQPRSVHRLAEPVSRREGDSDPAAAGD
jgi:hypothetical protein